MGDNRRADAFEPFADYLTTVTRHFRDQWHVPFETPEPLNEPAANWWHAGRWQEGCHFGRPAQDRIVALVGRRLRDAGLTTTVAASDENSIDDAVVSLGALSPASRSFVSLVTTHSYGGHHRAALCELARSYGKELWVSEDGDAHPSGLLMAERIVADLRGLHCSACAPGRRATPPPGGACSATACGTSGTPATSAPATGWSPSPTAGRSRPSTPRTSRSPS